jgi:hypothetical protein
VSGAFTVIIENPSETVPIVSVPLEVVEYAHHVVYLIAIVFQFTAVVEVSQVSAPFLTIVPKVVDTLTVVFTQAIVTALVVTAVLNA